MLGIEGYEPQWHHDGRALAAAHRVRFGRLIGQRLVGSWLMWDEDELTWFTGGPVILGFGDQNLEITHRKFDECGITWDQIDMSMPLDWPGLRLDWRADIHPGLAAVRGRPLRAANVIERITAAQWRPSVLHAIELIFEAKRPGTVRLTIYNALDENGIAVDPESDLPLGGWERIAIA